jgi:hypothetical protein
MLLIRFALCTLVLAASAHGKSPASTIKRVAAVVTEYRQNSHADVIVGRLLETHTLDGKGEVSPLKLVSLYTDQVPDTDTSRKLAEKHQFKIYPTVADTLTLGTGKLAVDGVLLVAEHGKYEVSPTGQAVWPKRRLFEQIVQVFETSGRVVPVFCDKHLADNWQDAQWIYETARRMKIPLMAGSSLPGLWRYPPLDPPRGTRFKEIVAVSYHTLDAYGFHSLEMLQAIAERRQGGETGIKAVRCLEGDAVWEAGEKRLYDPELLAGALATLLKPPSVSSLKEKVKKPVLFHVEYADGLRANVLTLNGAVGEWSIAWRLADGDKVEATRFQPQELRPFMHFTYQLKGVEQMMQTGQPAWPAERTLMSSGLLDALLISKQKGGDRLETPYLTFAYTVDWNWKQPPPTPPDRPLNE